jgi:tRNA(Ile)-lysidine synthase
MESTRNSSPPVEPASRVAVCLNRHVRQGESLVVALSGGIDSVVLLHVLHELSRHHGFRLSALHVNHRLSPHADDWQMFCRRLCQSLGIPIEVERIEVRNMAASGLEAAARQARYAAFAKMDADWLVLAHQRDDQAETLLFNLLRGAGLAGAAAMPAVRAFPGRPGLRILRPLLEVPRAEIEQYARERHLAWIEDESNRDVRHARNFLRWNILPPLRERFPGCGIVLARAAAHFAEGDALLSQLAEIDARTALREGRIVVAELARLDEARARNLLRHVLKGAGFAMPDSARLHEVLRQACHAAADRQVRIDLGYCMLHRYRGELWLTPTVSAPGEADWHGEVALAWGRDSLRFERIKGDGIGMDRLDGKPVRILPRLGGERFQPDARRPRRELKKLLQEHGVPPWQRETMPLLWCGEELVWVPGIGIDCAWQCRDGEAGLLPVWEQA